MFEFALYFYGENGEYGVETVFTNTGREALEYGESRLEYFGCDSCVAVYEGENITLTYFRDADGIWERDGENSHWHENAVVIG